jgi:hypothetical protein
VVKGVEVQAAVASSEAYRAAASTEAFDRALNSRTNLQLVTSRKHDGRKHGASDIEYEAYSCQDARYAATKLAEIDGRGAKTSLIQIRVDLEILNTARMVNNGVSTTLSAEQLIAATLQRIQSPAEVVSALRQYGEVARTSPTVTSDSK